MMAAKYEVRKMVPDDTSFIFDSWLKSWRSNRHSGVIPNNLYYSTYRATIEGLIGRGAEVDVACMPNNPDHILGWICWETTPDEKSCIHYLYVKDPFIGKFIDHALLDCVAGQKPGFYTFNYPQVVNALGTRYQGVRWQWAPEIGRRK